MSRASDNEKAWGLFILIISILAFLAILVLVVIHVSRVIFWFSLLGSVISLFVSIGYFISGAMDSFEQDERWEVSVIALLIFIVLFIMAHASYNMGYSDTAIQTEMEMRGYLVWYDNIMGALDVGGQVNQVTSEAIMQSINESCKQTGYDCDSARKGYQTYTEVIGLKDTADKFEPLLIFR